MRTFPVTHHMQYAINNSQDVTMVDLLNENSALQAIILEQDAKIAELESKCSGCDWVVISQAVDSRVMELKSKIRDLEAVQAKLADWIFHGTAPNEQYFGPESYLQKARRECGIKE